MRVVLDSDLRYHTGYYISGYITCLILLYMCGAQLKMGPLLISILSNVFRLLSH